jgi:hypothetical protein
MYTIISNSIESVEKKATYARSFAADFFVSFDVFDWLFVLREMSSLVMVRWFTTLCDSSSMKRSVCGR